jgi:hypothetical protein
MIWTINDLYSILADMIDVAYNSDDVDMAINRAIDRILRMIDGVEDVPPVPYVPCETHDGPCDRYCGHGAEPRTAAGSLD